MSQSIGSLEPRTDPGLLCILVLLHSGLGTSLSYDVCDHGT